MHKSTPSAQNGLSEETNTNQQVYYSQSYQSSPPKCDSRVIQSVPIAPCQYQHNVAINSPFPPFNNAVHAHQMPGNKYHHYPLQTYHNQSQSPFLVHHDTNVCSQYPSEQQHDHAASSSTSTNIDLPNHSMLNQSKKPKQQQQQPLRNEAKGEISRNYRSLSVDNHHSEMRSSLAPPTDLALALPIHHQPSTSPSHVQIFPPASPHHNFAQSNTDRPHSKVYYMPSPPRTRVFNGTNIGTPTGSTYKRKTSDSSSIPSHHFLQLQPKRNTVFLSKKDPVSTHKKHRSSPLSILATPNAAAFVGNGSPQSGRDSPDKQKKHTKRHEKGFLYSIISAGKKKSTIKQKNISEKHSLELDFGRVHSSKSVPKYIDLNDLELSKNIHLSTHGQPEDNRKSLPKSPNQRKSLSSKKSNSVLELDDEEFEKSQSSVDNRHTESNHRTHIQKESNRNTLPFEQTNKTPTSEHAAYTPQKHTYSPQFHPKTMNLYQTQNHGPKLPSVDQIKAGIPANASPIFHLLDRRVNFDSHSQKSSCYSLLRSWVQDDPYRFIPPPYSNLLDLVSLPTPIPFLSHDTRDTPESSEWKVSPPPIHRSPKKNDEQIRTHNRKRTAKEEDCDVLRCLSYHPPVASAPDSRTNECVSRNQNDTSSLLAEHVNRSKRVRRLKNCASAARGKKALERLAKLGLYFKAD